MVTSDWPPPPMGHVPAPRSPSREILLVPPFDAPFDALKAGKRLCWWAEFWLDNGLNWLASWCAKRLDLLSDAIEAGPPVRVPDLPTYVKPKPKPPPSLTYTVSTASTTQPSISHDGCTVVGNRVIQGGYVENGMAKTPVTRRVRKQVMAGTGMSPWERPRVQHRDPTALDDPDIAQALSQLPDNPHVARIVGNLAFPNAWRCFKCNSNFLTEAAAKIHQCGNAPVAPPISQWTCVYCGASFTTAAGAQLHAECCRKRPRRM